MSKQLAKTLALLAAARKRATLATRRLRELRAASAADQRTHAAELADLRRQLATATERVEIWESYYRMAVSDCVALEARLAGAHVGWWLAMLANTAAALTAGALALYHLGYF